MEPESSTAGSSSDSGETGGGGNIRRELATTLKPQAKVSGKRAREKQEFQNKLLEVLEKDMSMPDEDPVDMMMSGISKRMCKALPEEEQFSLLHKLQGCVNEHIASYKRSVVVANTNLDASFLAPGANTVNVSGEAVHRTLQVAQPVPRPPPPMIRAGHQVPQQAVQQDAPDFFERELTYQQL